MHPKIKELRLKAAPITYSSMTVDSKGELIDDERIIRGYLCVWGVRDSHGTGFIKGCFAKSLQERGVESNANQKIIFLWMHDQKNPIGQFRTLREDDYGLYFEAVIDDISEGDRAIKQVRSGTLNQFSFGFDYIWDKMEYDEKNDTVWIAECALYEGSVVSFGSIKETFAYRSMNEFENDMELLQEDTADFIKSIPRAKQLELRTLINRHIALAKVEPQELRQQALNGNEPQKSGIDYNYLKNNLKIA